MIRKASFRNFKSLREVDVEFERFTVIVGPNASGKTSILQGLDYISKLCGLKSDEKVASDEQLAALLSKGAEEDEFEVRVWTDKFELMWCQSVGGEMISTKYSGHIRELVDQTQKWDTLQSLEDRKKRLLLEFQDAILLSFESGGLSSPSYSSEIPPRIHPDGAGLSSALAYMALNRPDAFQEIQENLRSIIPSVKRVRFDRVSQFRTESETVKIDNDQLVRQVRKEYLADTLIFDFHGVPGIPASGVSEGTLIVLGLLTVIMGASRPQLIFLDDLERGLHPTAQRELIKLIRKLLVQFPELQIIATTHSPYLLDDLEPQEVLLTWADEDGITSCARIDQHPEFERWKNEMSPGEFWSVMGEKWVKDVSLQKVS